MNMTIHGNMDKDTFLHLAKAAGLDTSDASHMEELYSYLHPMLSGLKALDEMDLGDVEPATTYSPPRE
jgi:hypothetical protein